jgi:hypothetical protein
MAQLTACPFPSWRRIFAILTGLWLSGSLLIPAARAQEAFTVTVSMASATLEKSGVVTVTGTLTCSKPAVEAWVEADVRQPVGRVQTIHGYGYDDELNTCDVTPQPVEAVLVPQDGKFAPGPAYVTIYASACTLHYCSSDAQTKPFKLKYAH